MQDTSTAAMVAQGIIRDQELTKEFVEQYAFGYGDDKDNQLWPKVMSATIGLSPAVLGEIAAAGKSFGTGLNGKGDDALPMELASNYQVHSGSYLVKYDSGLELLQTLAATALICWIHLLLTDTATNE